MLKILELFVTFPPIIMWKKWVPTVVTFQIRPISIIPGERVGEIQKLNCDSCLARLKIAFRIFAEIKVLDLPIWVQFNLKEFYQKMMHPWCLSDFHWKKRLVTRKFHLYNIPSARACSISSQKLQEGIRSPQPEKLEREN